MGLMNVIKRYIKHFFSPSKLYICSTSPYRTFSRQKVPSHNVPIQNILKTKCPLTKRPPTKHSQDKMSSYKTSPNKTFSRQNVLLQNVPQQNILKTKCPLTKRPPTKNSQDKSVPVHNVLLKTFSRQTNITPGTTARQNIILPNPHAPISKHPSITKCSLSQNITCHKTSPGQNVLLHRRSPILN